MAKESIHSEGRLRVVTIDKQETVTLISFLVSMLADKAVPNNAAGVVPTLNIVEHGMIKCRIAISLQEEEG